MTHTIIFASLGPGRSASASRENSVCHPNQAPYPGPDVRNHPLNRLREALELPPRIQEDGLEPGLAPVQAIDAGPPSGLELSNALKIYDPSQAAGAGHVGTAWVTSTGAVYFANFTGRGDLVSNPEMRVNGMRVPVDSRGNVTPEGIEMVAEVYSNYWATREPAESNSGRTIGVVRFRGRDDGSFLRTLNELREMRHGSPGVLSRGQMEYGLANWNCAHVGNFLMRAVGVRPQVLPGIGRGYSQAVLPNAQFMNEVAMTAGQAAYTYRYRR